MSYISKFTQENSFKQAFFKITNQTALNVFNFLVKSSRLFKSLFFSRMTIARAVGLKSEEQVTRITNELEDLGMITKIIYKKTRTCLYVVNPLIFKLWINFYRKIPALSIMFLAPQKPLPINNVSLYKKDKGMIYSCESENVLNNYQHFLVNTPDPAYCHKPTPQQVQYAVEIFNGPTQRMDIAIESPIPPNIYVKSEGYDTRQYQSGLFDMVSTLTRRTRAVMQISRF